jgi:hypothetical protein
MGKDKLKVKRQKLKGKRKKYLVRGVEASSLQGTWISAFNFCLLP